MMKSQQIMKKNFNDCSSSENPSIYSSKLENKYFAKIQQIQNSQNLKSYKQITHLIKSENIVNGIIESQPAESKSSKKVKQLFNCSHQKMLQIQHQNNQLENTAKLKKL